MSEARPTRRRLLEVGSAALLTAVAGCTLPSANSDGSGRTPSTAAADSPYAAVYRDAIDSVVLVETGQGQGTGFVFDETHVVTNAHVAGQASTTAIRFNGGHWSDGDVVGTDPHSDLAAIAVDDVPSEATPLPFVDGTVAIGQEVVAIGNPFNLNGTVTTGIVSGTDRSIPAPTGYRIPDAIQTDAAVNPGNSGGPLMTLDGRVAAVINSGGGDNIAFGISAALTQRVVPELIETGSYDHAYLGISFTDVTPAIAQAHDLEDPRGLLVVEATRGGPADGVLQPTNDVRLIDGKRVQVGGDILLAIDGTEITTSEDLGSHLALQARPGETVELTVLRDGSERTVELELGTRPA
ncbi:S1C family serine protease [Halopiger djelfimassiliensis]|uniref:S1C family serine protease n=1 Tax=Halopiger djelfimassiliensis TaxID=1293047 RepID=UPI0006780C5C|nr:trypsin-like peptidase domain-containing protein [Halopiger djelfimassiliensis]